MNNQNIVTEDKKNGSNYEDCRTVIYAGIEKFGVCKTETKVNCKYLVNYGLKKFCTHPDWRKFLVENEE